MSEKIQVRLIGPPRVLVGEETVRFPYRKTEGVFYLLCVRKQVTRDELVNLFWAGTDESSGKKSVRQVLYQLKKCLGEDVILTQGNQAVFLNPAIPMTVDWDLQGQAFLDREGEFLHFFYIRDCLEFEDWMEDCRRLLMSRREEELLRQMEEARSERDVDALRIFLKQWVQMNLLSEKIVISVMEWYAHHGMYNQAIQLFYDYKKKLLEELEEEPGEGVLALFHRVYRMKETGMETANRPQDTFFARTAELFRCDEQIQKFQRGEKCRSLVIRGVMGVGKTALMERILRNYRSENLLILSCHATQADHDFYLRSCGQFLHQLEQYLDEGTVSISERQREYLHRMNHRGTIHRSDSRTTGNAAFPVMENELCELFRSLSETRKIVLCVDDIQWMDPLSCQAIQTLMKDLGNRELFLLATSRDKDITAVDELLFSLKRSGLVEILELQPFSESETEMIVKQLLPEMKMEAEAIHRIWRRTEGNALMLMDLLKITRQEGQLPDQIPDMTSHMLELQLKQLTPDQLQLMQILSIFIDSADIDEIRILMRRDILSLYELLESLQNRYLIHEQFCGEILRYSFSHRAYHEYFYANQSLGKRRVLHQMIAEYYEDMRDDTRWFELLPFLIYHYERSGNRTKAEAYRVQYYCEFFALNNENFPVLRTNMEYDEVAVGMSDNEQVILEMANRLITENVGGNQSLIAECHFLLGRSAIARGSYPDGLAHIRACIRLTEPAAQRSLLLGAYRQMIFYGIQVDDREIMRDYLQRGLNLLGEERHSADYATLLRLKGLYCLRCDQLEEAEDNLRDAFGIFSSLRSKECQFNLSRAACVNYLGRIHLQRGRRHVSGDLAEAEYRKAEEYFREATEMGVCRYVTNGMGQFRTNLGAVQLMLGKLPQAEKSLREAIHCFRKHEGFYWGWDRAELYLAEVCDRLGLKSEAEEHLKQAEMMIPIMGNPDNLAKLERFRNRE